MNKLSSYVQLRKEYDSIAGYHWKAYWRGTNNRIRQANGELVPGRFKQSALRFDLLNNPVEQGVLALDLGKSA